MNKVMSMDKADGTFVYFCVHFVESGNYFAGIFLRFISHQSPWLKKGETVDEVAKTFHVSSRGIEQLVKIFKDTGKYPILNPRRRPKVYLSEDQRQIIKQAYSESYFGAKMLRYHIKKRHKQNIPQNKIHAYLLEIGLAKPDAKKRKKTKAMPLGAKA